MTEDFKKGLATGIAVGGVTINKGGKCECIIVGSVTPTKYQVSITGDICVSNIIIGTVEEISR